MPKHFYDFRHLFLVRLRKEMKASTLEGDFTTSLRCLCVRILFGTLAQVTRLCLAILRQHSGVCVSQVYRSLADFDRLTGPPVVPLFVWSTKNLKKPFRVSVPGNWTSLLGTNMLARSHAFNICCRTRCSIHETTPPIQCDQTCTVPACSVLYTCFARL